MTTVLFFDDWWLDKRVNLNRRLGSPSWVPEAILEDDITDGTWNFPFVFRDEMTGKWLGFYAGMHYPPPHGKRRSTGLCIAESEDGIHWRKPDLSERIPIPNRNRPNQVLSVGKMDGGPVYLDTHDPNPERRLKFLYSGFSDCREESSEYNRELLMATSGDGYTWRTERLNWRDRSLDAPISVYYNHYRKQYMVNSRPNWGDRRVALTPTSDFQTFEDPILVMHPDPEDPPTVQFYGMPIYRYENLYLGFLWRIHVDPASYRKGPGEVDCALAYSYDGVIFNRAWHEAFVPLNERGTYGGGCIYVSALAIDEDDRIRLYSGASKTGHFQTNAVSDAALALHTLRRDGFVYLESYATSGLLATKLVRFHAPELSMNVRAPYGSVRVQLTDLQGTPYPGFSFGESVAYTGDNLYFEPKWTGDPSLAALSEQPVHIEVEVTRGEIYAIRGNFSMSTANPNVTLTRASLGLRGYMA